MFGRRALLLICTIVGIMVRSDGRSLAANAMGQSGCSAVFAYKTRASDAYTYGLISVAQPPGLGGTMDLVVLLSVDGRVPKVITTIWHLRHAICCNTVCQSGVSGNR